LHQVFRHEEDLMRFLDRQPRLRLCIVVGALLACCLIRLAAEKNLVTMDVRDGDIRKVLMQLAQKGNINLLISPKISGTITFRVSEMDPLELIEFIVKANGLELEDHGRIKLVMGESVPGPNFRFEIISLQYAKAEEVQKMIEQLKLDKKTKVTHDTHGNRLIVIRYD